MTSVLKDYDRTAPTKVQTNETRISASAMRVPIFFCTVGPCSLKLPWCLNKRGFGTSISSPISTSLKSFYKFRLWDTIANRRFWPFSVVAVIAVLGLPKNIQDLSWLLWQISKFGLRDRTHCFQGPSIMMVRLVMTVDVQMWELLGNRHMWGPFWVEMARTQRE